MRLKGSRSTEVSASLFVDRVSEWKVPMRRLVFKAKLSWIICFSWGARETGRGGENKVEWAGGGGGRSSTKFALVYVITVCKGQNIQEFKNIFLFFLL